MINPTTDDAVLASVVEALRHARKLQEGSTETLERVNALLDDLRTTRADGQLASLADEIAGLHEAMDSRAVIEQAKGIIMATTGCDAEQAFRTLAQQSQHENRKLRDVAAELVSRRQKAS